MPDGITRLVRALALAAAVVVAGCWNAVASHCSGCVIVSERAPALPRIARDSSAVVILVHGAFGFGDEWRGVVDAVRARPKTMMLAFAWSGPWTRKPSLAAEALLAVVQRAIDDAPPQAQLLGDGALGRAAR